MHRRKTPVIVADITAKVELAVLQSEAVAVCYLPRKLDVASFIMTGDSARRTTPEIKRASKLYAGCDVGPRAEDVKVRIRHKIVRQRNRGCRPESPAVDRQRAGAECVVSAHHERTS